ncbi:MAG: ankyrin repeat domain-containing protein, partial [Thermoguttaceae bacterium]|nr:ankyrin repeat domain-containing protein [Thermoguttaceae bacterium]
NKKLIRFLVEHGADVNLKNNTLGNFGNPLTIAVGYDNLKIVRYLVEHGANVNPYFDQTWVPYWYELWKEGTVDPEIVRYLRCRDYIFNGGIAILLLIIVVILAIALRMGYRRKTNEIN